MQSDDDAWLNAGAALIASTPPDPKPLAALLREAFREQRPIPVSTIDLLADLLDPPPNDPLGRRLAIEKTKNITADFEKNAPLVSEYNKQYQAAKEADEIGPHQLAKENTAKKFDTSESTVDRARRSLNNLQKWLRDE